ncbi:MAG TPA: hypothetical protein VG452_12555 [Egibacteraceae bacterium]|nr:hypothetical protein [Egibacteraceae bacterium]
MLGSKNNGVPIIARLGQLPVHAFELRPQHPAYGNPHDENENNEAAEHACHQEPAWGNTFVALHGFCMALGTGSSAR